MTAGVDMGTEAAVAQFADVRGFTVGALEALDVVESKEAGRVAEVRFPMRDAASNRTGWRRRRADGQPFGNAGKALTVAGGHNGLIYPLPFPDTGVVLVVEGETDCAAALSALPGLAVCGTPGASPGRACVQELQKFLASRSDVVLAPDGDDAGSSWRDMVGRALTGAQCAVRYILPEAGRDLDDRLRRETDKAKTLRELLDGAIPWQGAASGVPLPATGGVGRDLHFSEAGLALEAKRRLLLDFTDAGNAELLALLYGDKLRYDHRRGQWFIWRGHWWQPDSDGEITRLALDAVRFRAQAIYDKLDDSEAKPAYAWAVRSRQRRRVLAALELAKSILPIADSGKGWDCNPFLLGVENGVLDLHTGELRAGAPQDRITRHTPVAFDPDAKCPRWTQFLREIFEGDAELVEHVHRAVGYALTGDTREHCFWLLHGKGANGKSVFLRTLRLVLGPYAYDAGFAAFELHGRAGIPEDVAHLEGKRLVTASEVQEGRRLNESRIKALTGQDTINARYLYGRRFEFQPSGKIFLAVNYLPRVMDDSIAFWRRARLVPFNRCFLGADADPVLADKLADELPGILAWAVKGTLLWQAEGLTLPKAVEVATAAYHIESDPLGRFLVDACTLRPEAFAPSGELFKAYREWADREGIPDRERVSHTAFGRKLGERFDKDRRIVQGRKQTVYVGVGIAEGDWRGD